MPSSVDARPVGATSPGTYAELRDRLAGGSIKLPRRLQQVAAYALAHPDDVALGTVAKIAEDAGVQPSALIRFAQTLGFSGFTDLQAVFRERLLSQVTNYDERLMSLRATGGETSKAGMLLDGLCKSATQSIGQLHARIDIDSVERATRILAEAETIYLVAQRRSFPITSYLSYALGKLGIRNILIGSAVGTDPETISFATPRDAALAISFTPYAPATIAHTRELGDAGVPLVVITDSPFSPLASDSRIWFEVVETDFQGFRSLSASMALAMTLALGVADRRQG
ncbi:MurR/RpiR family transcriptional regulator [Aureimonas phyllosphaerae]|uniref:DNA-binding MurR/RpiR family transcriptional regulator n=1 Tax=Aureimonas phyllosphaerae TaxID=1166078 RepID=A0A7W6BQL5_9HYPH|nr:MurR/RpiR family transcriptional regulator [Aureimonas phyllosphaerae]MBB3935107.1 DNA-binding MurR/RpiR family transcriptional regulator [Aureimonas phyllosphaerae]MBB3959115.1 DNA-binding MurR/RpiR family transcriptional regulator [Aureimonas phyllosphaerae]SFF07791.1 transcriptional regulator, RpiR family [Aureimonas phyllosphaerae]